MVVFSTLLAASLVAAAVAQHDDHQHSDDDVADCSCITGYDTDTLEEAVCDDTDTLEAIQQYLEDNDCTQYCHLHGDHGMWHEASDDSDVEESFDCLQAFSLLVQYHDFCPTGSVDEEMFHEYLEVCPDCKQEHYYHSGAPECSGDLMCMDTAAQEMAVTYVSNNCVDSCEGNCTEVWQMVEGYHRMCAHGDLSEAFELIYDSAFEETVCGEDIYCNVPWEANYTADCSSDANEDYAGFLETYGTLDVDAITDEYSSGAVQHVVIGLVAVLSVASVFFV